ncbi:alpha/beta hydrolase [Paenibacillus soyae]|uniref:alpha/beta hydrolase n=1 Tax=Paenibacillus soyae TaxID=2969249 RepID=UPI00214A7DDD
MRALVRIGKVFSFLVTMTGVGIWCVIRRSPAPFIRWFRRLPDPGPSAPLHLADYERMVDTHRNLEYPSRYGSNRLDLYHPKEGRDKLPTILWVHGGGFVSGDKSGTAYWCTMMASQGYTVVSMNYEVAPEAKYPAPVVQMSEVYDYLSVIAGDYPTLDMSRLIIGGDSAGAQIASQFIAIQTNPELAGLTGIEQVVPKGALLAALLYCGPYNVNRLADAKGRLARFYLNHLGWAYIGERGWRNSAKAAHASTVHYATGNYPPTFITDGNTGSFEKHGRELAERLRSRGVPVTSLFYPMSHGIVHHEYQFKLDTAEAGECFEMTLSFLEECLGRGNSIRRIDHQENSG